MSWTWRRWVSGTGCDVPEMESGCLVCVGEVVMVVGGYQEEACEEEEEEESEEGLVVYVWGEGGWKKEVVGGIPHLEGAVTVGRGDDALLHGGVDTDYETRGETYSIKANPLQVTVLTETGPLRSRHAACLTANTAYFYGGINNAVVADDLYEYNPATRSWKEVNITGGKPQGRYSCALSATQNSLVMYGGAYVDGPDQRSLGDLWMCCVEGGIGVWTHIVTHPSPLNGHVGVVLPSEVSPTPTLLLYGGAAGAASGGGATGSYSNSPTLIDLVDPPHAPTPHPTTGTNPLGLYLPSATLSPSKRSLLIQGGTKRLPGPGDVFELTF